MKQTLNAIGVVILNFIPSALIPYLLDYFNLLTTSDSLLMGVLIWILLNCSVLLYKIGGIEQNKQEEKLFLRVQDAFDVKLFNIREAYRKNLRAKKGTPDLFQSFFDERISELNSIIEKAVYDDKLEITTGHIASTAILLGTFKGANDDIFRPVHKLEDNNWFFDTFSKKYFYDVFRLVKEHKIKAVKGLMLYSSPEELKNPKSIQLMKFHAVTKGYSYKVMSTQTFQLLLADAKIEVPRDFGIYGNKYLFIAVKNSIDDLRGYWRKGTDVISKYIDFFEECWNSPDAITLGRIDDSGTMSLDELFEEN